MISLFVVYAVNLCIIGYLLSKLAYNCVLGGSAPWQKPSGSAVKKQAPAVPSTVSTGASSSKPSTPRQKTGASEDEWCKVCISYYYYDSNIVAVV